VKVGAQTLSHTQDNGTNSPPRRVFWMGVAVLVAYALFTWWLIRSSSASSEDWARLTYLYQGVEAVVFAAAGAIFGTAVLRGQVSDAKDGEREAKTSAAQAELDARIGRALEAAVRAAASSGSEEAPPAWSGRIGSGAPSTSSGREEVESFAGFLARLAQELRDIGESD